MSDVQEKLCYYFSITSGELFQIFESERKNTTKYQIPLIDKPSSSCRKCYGRGYIGRNTKLEYYMPCSCITKLIDGKHLKEDEVTVETPKLTSELASTNLIEKQ